jgi:hypothetical protein
MATDNFREDIPWRLRAFAGVGAGPRPTVLKVNYIDAMNWLKREGFAVVPIVFVKQYIEPFVKSLRCNGEELSECSVDLRSEQDGQSTLFE